MFRNAATALLLAATFAASVLTHATDAGAGSKYDGPWSVVVYTKTGPCDASYRFSGQILNGEISYSYSSLTVTGHIAPSGATVVKVTVGTSHGEAHGHLSPMQGGGTWSGVGPDGPCSGTWVATRPAAM